MELSLMSFPKVTLKVGRKEEDFVLFTLFIDSNLKVKGLWFETILSVSDEIYDVLFLPEELKYDNLSGGFRYPPRKPLKGPAGKEFAELLNTLNLDRYIDVNIFELSDGEYYFETREGKRKRLSDLIIDIEKWKIAKCVVRKLFGSQIFIPYTILKEDEKVIFRG